MGKIKRNNFILPLNVFTGGMFIILLIGGAAVFSPVAGAAKNAVVVPPVLETNEARQQELADLLATYFTYQRENRSDPFTPFIKKTTPQPSARKGEKIPIEALTGMQLFEPSQLTLVSIVFSEDKSIAMVQDSVGQGYVISKGTEIGRSGVVEEILPNVVVIKQWSMTLSGQRRYKNIEMVLRKEGE